MCSLLSARGEGWLHGGQRRNGSPGATAGIRPECPVDHHPRRNVTRMTSYVNTDDTRVRLGIAGIEGETYISADRQRRGRFLTAAATRSRDDRPRDRRRPRGEPPTLSRAYGGVDAIWGRRRRTGSRRRDGEAGAWRGRTARGARCAKSETCVLTDRHLGPVISTYVPERISRSRRRRRGNADGAERFFDLTCHHIESARTRTRLLALTLSRRPPAHPPAARPSRPRPPLVTPARPASRHTDFAPHRKDPP